jgi:disulfide bond formation protein DsbB
MLMMMMMMKVYCSVVLSCSLCFVVRCSLFVLGALILFSLFYMFRSINTMYSGIVELYHGLLGGHTVHITDSNVIYIKLCASIPVISHWRSLHFTRQHGIGSSVSLERHSQRHEHRQYQTTGVLRTQSTSDPECTHTILGVCASPLR